MRNAAPSESVTWIWLWLYLSEVSINVCQKTAFAGNYMFSFDVGRMKSRAPALKSAAWLLQPPITIHYSADAKRETQSSNARAGKLTSITADSLDVWQRGSRSPNWRRSLHADPGAPQVPSSDGLPSRRAQRRHTDGSIVSFPKEREF